MFQTIATVFTTPTRTRLHPHPPKAIYAKQQYYCKFARSPALAPHLSMHRTMHISLYVLHHVTIKAKKASSFPVGRDTPYPPFAQLDLKPRFRNVELIVFVLPPAPREPVDPFPLVRARPRRHIQAVHRNVLRFGVRGWNTQIQGGLGRP